MELNADFNVSRPGKDEGLNGIASGFGEVFFNIPVKEEEGFLAPFFRVELIAFVTECGWNLAYSLCFSCKYQHFALISVRRNISRQANAFQMLF